MNTHNLTFLENRSSLEATTVSFVRIQTLKPGKFPTFNFPDGLVEYHFNVQPLISSDNFPSRDTENSRGFARKMKRGTKCIAQTINLSNPESCIRPKKIQKLVGMDAMQPCPRTTADTGSYWTSRPVTVKICSRRDVQRTCQPKVRSPVKKQSKVSSLQSSLTTIVTTDYKLILQGLPY